MIDINTLRFEVQLNKLDNSQLVLSPSVVEDLLDRIETAEKERDALRTENAGLVDDMNLLRDNNTALRARIEEMGRQEPVAWVRKLGLDLPSVGCVTDLKYRPSDIPESSYIPLYLAPGAQPAQSREDEAVRKAWARFSNELHSSPDAPYPGMSEAFEQHFSQSFTDREWRAESATWAAAWKAAKRHEEQEQPVPKAVAYLDLGVGGYMDIGTDLTDEVLATIPKGRHMLGIVGTYGVEGYSPAQPAPSIPEGWKLVPTAESRHPGIYKMLSVLHAVDNTPGASEWESYAAFLAAAPEAKP